MAITRMWRKYNTQEANDDLFLTNTVIRQPVIRINSKHIEPYIRKIILISDNVRKIASREFVMRAAVITGDITGFIIYHNLFIKN